MKSLIATLLICFAASSAVSAEFSDAELVKLGESYAGAINQLDADALNALISARHLAESAAEIAGDNDAEKAEFTRAFAEAIPSISGRMLLELERQEAYAVFLRVHEMDGMRGPLVRYTVGDGYNYALLLPVSKNRLSRSAYIGDLYFATSGERMSESLGVAAKLVSAPSETFLGKLFGVSNIDPDVLDRFRKLGQYRQQGKLREAYDVLDQMPGDARNNRLILINTIQIAAQFDESLYRQELKRLATHHKDDPKVAFTLLDHYFYEEDYDAAMSTINLMASAYGEDAVMYIFRANLELERGRPDEALVFARKAVDLESDNEVAQWVHLNVATQTERFAEGVEVARVLERDFSYAFTRDDFAADPYYDSFVASKAFAQWIGSR